MVQVSLQRRKPMIGTRRRLIGAAVAIGINAMILVVLGVTDGPRGSLDQESPLEVISLTLVRTRPVQRVIPEEPARKRIDHRPRAKKLGDPVLTASGPPTETVAQLSHSGEPDRDADIPDLALLEERCRQEYPEQLANREADVTVKLRVFVMPDGRIAQGRIDRSSGDEEFDRKAFICLQTYSNLTPTVIEGNPVGSWQTVEMRWMQ